MANFNMMMEKKLKVGISFTQSCYNLKRVASFRLFV